MERDSLVDDVAYLQRCCVIAFWRDTVSGMTDKLNPLQFPKPAQRRRSQKPEISEEMQRLRNAIIRLQHYRASVMHLPGSVYAERQQGEVAAFSFVLRLIDGEEL